MEIRATHSHSFSYHKRNKSIANIEAVPDTKISRFINTPSEVSCHTPLQSQAHCTQSRTIDNTDVLTRMKLYQESAQKRISIIKEQYYNAEQYTFQPNINKTSEIIAKKLKETPNKCSKKVYKDQNCTFHPQISRISTILSYRKGNSNSRLLKPKEPSTIRNSPLCSFSPVINFDPKRNVPNQELPWVKLYEEGNKIKERIEEERKRNEVDKSNEAMSKCTFHPSISSTEKSYCIDSNVEQRNKEWNDSKNKKLKQMRDISSLTGLEHCTFKPSINKINTKEHNATPKVKMDNSYASMYNKKCNINRKANAANDKSIHVDSSIQDAMGLIHEELRNIDFV